MATQLGTGHIHSLSGGTLGCSDTSITGYVAPNMQTLRLGHAADVDRIKSQAGKTTGLIFEDDTIECTFEVIPEGTTIANAKLSAQIPDAGSAFTITGLPIIDFGGFDDALNTNGGSTQPWIYEGGAQLNGMADGKWTLTLPLKRYVSITSATAIT